MMRRALFYYNPCSGAGRGGALLDNMITVSQSLGWHLLPVRVDNPRLVSSIAKEMECERVIAAGGDGTLHYCVNALAGTGVAIGIVPLGTSNDLAYQVNIPQQPEAALRLALTADPCPVDLGRVGKRRFVNVLAGGAIPSVAHSVPQRLKNTLGRAAYFLHGAGVVLKLDFFPLQVICDGIEVFSEEAALFMLLNGRGAAGFYSLAPESQLDNGYLRLLVVKRATPGELLALLAQAAQGSGLNEDLVFSCQGKKWQVNSSRKVESDLDGEQGPDLPLEVDTEEKALQLIYKK